MQGGDHKKGGRGDGGGGELLFRPKTNHIMFNIPQKLVFGQSRPVPPGGIQGGDPNQGAGRGGMVFLGPPEMIPPIRNCDPRFLASPAQSRSGVPTILT